MKRKTLTLAAAAFAVLSAQTASAQTPAHPQTTSRSLRSHQASDHHAGNDAGASLAPLSAQQLAATAHPSDESLKAVNEEQARLHALDAQTGELTARLDQLDSWLKQPVPPPASPPLKRRRLHFPPWHS